MSPLASKWGFRTPEDFNGPQRRRRVPSQAQPAAASISADEASFFGKLAEDWWNPAGSSAMLHRITPVRSAFIRDQAAAHFRREPRQRRPFTGLAALDIGCGAGLQTEPLARMGFAVNGHRCRA